MTGLSSQLAGMFLVEYSLTFKLTTVVMSRLSVNLMTLFLGMSVNLTTLFLGKLKPKLLTST